MHCLMVEDRDILTRKFHRKVLELSALVRSSPNTKLEIKSMVNDMVGFVHRLERASAKDNTGGKRDAEPAVTAAPPVVRIDAATQTRTLEEQPKISQPTNGEIGGRQHLTLLPGAILTVKASVGEGIKSNSNRSRSDGPAKPTRKAPENVQGTEATRGSDPAAGTSDEETYDSGGKDQDFQVYSRKKKGRKKAITKPTTTRRTDDVVVVRVEGKTFAEVLREVKSGPNPEGCHITGIQKGKDEDLQIRLKHNASSKVNVLRTMILGKIPNAKVVSRTREAILHVQDIDEDTSAQDVQNSVAEAAGITTEDVRVTSLRPAYRSTQKATVRVSERAAKKLMEKGHVQIGWISCRIQIREKDERCYRCWRAGHKASACDGPDRSGLCYRCGKDGHKQRECTGTQHCVECDRSGHSSGKCPKTGEKTPNNG